MPPPSPPLRHSLRAPRAALLRDVAGAASAPERGRRTGMPPAPRPPSPPSPRTALSRVPPAARQAAPGLLPFGTPGPLFWTCGGAGSERDAACPARARATVRWPGTAGPARRGSSQAPGKVAPRGGGGGWWAEAVSVGEAIALLSPKSKVLGAGSRTRSPGSRGRLGRAGLRLLKEPRRPAPASSPPPPRRDQCT